MLAKVLTKPDEVHTVADDLESFFYVFLYICSMFLGPNKGQKKEDLPFYIHFWLYQPNMVNVGVEKSTIIKYSLPEFWLMTVPFVLPTSKNSVLSWKNCSKSSIDIPHTRETLIMYLFMTCYSKSSRMPGTTLPSLTQILSQFRKIKNFSVQMILQKRI